MLFSIEYLVFTAVGYIMDVTIIRLGILDDTLTAYYISERPLRFLCCGSLFVDTVPKS